MLQALKPYPQVHDMALLSLRTGLRFKEMCGIRGKDIDWKNDMIGILDPKDKNAEICYVYLTPDIKERLQKYNTSPGEYVFKNRKGERVKEVSDTFERVVKKLGFNEGITDNRQKLTFHSLRHTFASWLALSNEQLGTIKELMRHTDVKMTMRYHHLIPSHKKQAVNKIAAKKED